MASETQAIIERYSYFMSQVRRRLDRARDVLASIDLQLQDERAWEGETDTFMDAEFAFLQIRYVCELTALAVLDAHRELDAARTRELRGAYAADRIFTLLEAVSPNSFPVAVFGWLDTSTGNGDIQPQPNQRLTKERLKEIYALSGDVLHIGRLSRWDKEGIKTLDAAALNDAFRDLDQHLSLHRTHLRHTNQDVIVKLRVPQKGGGTAVFIGQRNEPLV